MSFPCGGIEGAHSSSTWLAHLRKSQDHRTWPHKRPWSTRDEVHIGLSAIFQAAGGQLIQHTLYLWPSTMFEERVDVPSTCKDSLWSVSSTEILANLLTPSQLLLMFSSAQCPRVHAANLQPSITTEADNSTLRYYRRYVSNTCQLSVINCCSRLDVHAMTIAL